jgi:hypothetical protein
MYKKQGSGINGAMGVLNNNLKYNGARGASNTNNIPKGEGYKPGANYNQASKVPSYMNAKPKVKRETSNQGRRPTSKVNPRIAPNNGYNQI